MGQFDRCSVKGCKKKRQEHKGELSFFRFPKSPPQRLEAWEVLAGRKKKAKKSWKICGNHFVSGKPSMKADNVDYIPTKNPGRKKRRDGHPAIVNKDYLSHAGPKHGSSHSVASEEDITRSTSSSAVPSLDNSGDKPSVSDKLPKRIRPRRVARTKQDSNHVKDLFDDSNCDDTLLKKDVEEDCLSYSSSDEDEKNTKTKKACLCPYCGKDCKFPYKLKGHVQVHGDRTYAQPGSMCQLCGKVLVNKYSLACHMKCVHPDPADMPSQFVCNVCGLKFPLNSRLKTHMAKHMEPSNVCKYCSKRFRHLSNLKTHIKGVHEGDSKYECPHCLKRFGNQYNLKVHCRRHTGEKPYTCLSCNKGYTDVANFRRHREKCSSVGIVRKMSEATQSLPRQQFTCMVPQQKIVEDKDEDTYDDFNLNQDQDLNSELQPQSRSQLALDLSSERTRDPVALQNKIQTAFAQMLDAGALDSRAFMQSGTFSLVLPQ